MSPLATMAAVRYRPATGADLLVLLDLLEAMREETFWRDVPFVPNRAAVGAWLMEAMADRSHYQVVVAEEQGEIVGLCMGQLAVNPLVPDVPYVYEIALYVRHEFRHQGIGARLWQTVMAWGRTLGARYAAYSRPIVGHGHEVERLIWRSLP